LYLGRFYDNRSMKTFSFGTWWLRIATFLLAALAAASATYWVLKWSAPAVSIPTAAPTVSSPAQSDPQSVARLLGGGQVASAAAVVDRAASRFKLTGVVASGAKGGYALIATDGQTAKPYRVGAAVSDALVLQSVAIRSAALGASLDAPSAFTLELPILARSDGKAASASNSPTVGQVNSPPESRSERKSRAKQADPNAE
jgi:general secretion pathway protein C